MNGDYIYDRDGTLRALGQLRDRLQPTHLVHETKTAEYPQLFHQSKLFCGYQLLAIGHQFTPLEVNLRIALDLPITATEKDVHNALVRKKINLARSCLRNIPGGPTAQVIRPRFSGKTAENLENHLKCLI